MFSINKRKKIDRIDSNYEAFKKSFKASEDMSRMQKSHINSNRKNEDRNKSNIVDLEIVEKRKELTKIKQTQALERIRQIQANAMMKAKQ